METGSHYRNDVGDADGYAIEDYGEGDGFAATHATSFLTGALLAFVFALILEALTLVGIPSVSPFDLSQWMPLRILVFFCALVPMASVFVYRLTRLKTGVFEAVGAHALPYTLTLDGVIGGLLIGWALGIPLASIAGDAGDARYSMVAGALFTSILLLAIHRKLVARALEWGFLILALSFGTCFCLLMPTGAEISWDGATHFKNANGLSYVFDARYTGADRIMCVGGLEGSLYLTGTLSYTEQQWVELNSRLVDFPHAILEDDTSESASDILRRAEKTEEVTVCEGTSVYPDGNFWSFRSIGLIPNAIGLWLGRLLGLDCIGRYLLARLTSVFVYSIVFFCAVRALRRGKLIMSAIGLAPTSLMMAANFSYDPWTICFCALFAGKLVGALQSNRTLDAWDSLSIAAPLVVGAIVKAVLFPLALMLLLLPKRRFRDAGAYAAHLGITAGSMLVLLASFVVPYIMPSGSVESQNDARGGSDVSVAGQIAYVREHPADTLKMSLGFALGMFNPLHLGFGLSPADENLLYYFPYLIATDAPLNEFLATLEYVLLLFVGITDGGPEDEGYKGVFPKVWTTISCLLSFALISGALYASFTDVGRDTISGVQYRYLIPLLAPFFLVVLNTPLRRREGEDWYGVAFSFVECVLLLLVTANSFMILF